MKKIIPVILLVIGLILFVLGRFIFTDSNFSDYFIRIGGVSILVGLFFSVSLWRQTKTDK